MKERGAQKVGQIDGAVSVVEEVGEEEEEERHVGGGGDLYHLAALSCVSEGNKNGP